MFKAFVAEPVECQDEFAMVQVGDSGLMKTWCGRYDRIAEFLLANPPRDLERRIAHLCDDRVMMDITVQQMTFQASTGEHLVRVP